MNADSSITAAGNLAVQRIPSWKLAADIATIDARQHSPTRCMNCIHDEAEHAVNVGCTVAGGTKRIEDETGAIVAACSCLEFVPAEDKETK